MGAGGDNAGKGPPRGAKPPKAAFTDLARRVGVAEHRLTRAFRRIKRSAGLPPDAHTLIDAEGLFYITDTGEWIGYVIDDR